MKRSLFALLVVGLFAGCAISNRRAGVQNHWRKVDIAQFKKGKTTEREILAALGPPSQILPLRKRTVFYYLLEHAHSSTLNLIVFVNKDVDVQYDRAVFFFDQSGRLEASSLSRERLPTRDDK